MAVQFMPPSLGGIPPNCKRHSAPQPMFNSDMETIGDRVRAERLHAGMSQQALGAAVGLKKETVRDLELGKSRTTTKLHSLADVLDVSVKWLETGLGPRKLNRSASQEEALSVLPHESRLARLDHATFTQAKRFVLAEETLAGPYPRDELVDQVFAVYDLMAESGGVLTHEQREGRFAAARLRHSERGTHGNDEGLQRGKTA